MRVGAGDTMTFYICDKKKPCSICNPNCVNDNCNHTADPEHALNGICLAPEHDDRFILTEFGDWWEVLSDKEKGNN